MHIVDYSTVLVQPHVRTSRPRAVGSELRPARAGTRARARATVGAALALQAVQSILYASYYRVHCMIRYSLL